MLKISKISRGLALGPSPGRCPSALGHQWHLHFNFTKLGFWKLWINFSITLRFKRKLSLASNYYIMVITWSLNVFWMIFIISTRIRNWNMKSKLKYAIVQIYILCPNCNLYDHNFLFLHSSDFFSNFIFQLQLPNLDLIKDMKLPLK